MKINAVLTLILVVIMLFGCSSDSTSSVQDNAASSQDASTSQSSQEVSSQEASSQDISQPIEQPLVEFGSVVSEETSELFAELEGYWNDSNSNYFLQFYREEDKLMCASAWWDSELGPVGIVVDGSQSDDDRYCFVELYIPAVQANEMYDAQEAYTANLTFEFDRENMNLIFSNTDTSLIMYYAGADYNTAYTAYQNS